MNSSSKRPPEATSVFFLIRSLAAGGAERQLVELASALHAAGHKVLVATYYPGGALREGLVERGVRVIHLGKDGRWDLIGFFRRLVRALRRERPDVLYSFLGTSNILATLARPFAPPLKLVWSVRASFMDLKAFDRVSGLSYRIECLLSRRADLIIANSEAGAAYAADNGFPRDRMVVVHNGIDTDRFRPDRQARARSRRDWGIGENDILIGILARFDPMKDYPTFLRAAALAAQERPDLRFVCIGEGPAETSSRLASLGSELGLDGRLVWAGAARDAAGALNGLDLCCSSSTGEGFSNSIAEAMACGIPCLVTDVGDSAALVGTTGWVVPPADPPRLAAAMVAAAASLSPDVREQARLRIERNYSLDRLLQDTLQAFGEAGPAAEA